MSPALALYRAASWAFAPAAGLYLRRRARHGKEDAARLGERLGHAGAARPAGPLVWLHGASVGEMTVLRLVHAALAGARSDLHFLITTGTATSAALAARTPFARGHHQFAPIDAPDAVRRFLEHWRPDMGVFAESEAWPNLILSARARGVRLALVNARLSPKSLAQWARTPRAAAAVFGAFDVLLCAEERTAAALRTLGAPTAAALANLKLAPQPPAPLSGALKDLRARIGARPRWIAASTHPGEDEIVLAAHARVRASRPDALLILAPRHPERGPAVAALAGGSPRRSTGALPGPDDPVYVADTLGELEGLYALAPLALVAGSLLPPLKGHNPVEPARAGAAILAGPHVESFAELYAALKAAGAVTTVANDSAIAAAVLALWTDEALRTRMTSQAARALDGGAEALAHTLAALLPLLPEAAHAGA